jgi:hypothetical protein
MTDQDLDFGADGATRDVLVVDEVGDPTDYDQFCEANGLTPYTEDGDEVEASLQAFEDSLPFVLTADNYHSARANKEFMSNSQHKNWIECPAQQFAIQQGDYKPEEKLIFIAGRYAHVHFLEPEKVEAMEKAHPDIRKTKAWTVDQLKAIAAEAEVDLKGHMKSKATIEARLAEEGVEIPTPEKVWGTDFKWLEGTIAAFEAQEVFMDLLTRGAHEVVIEFEIGGVPWKAMIDNLRVGDKQFDDLKFMRDFSDSWSKELRRYVHWFETYSYDQQMAVYREAVRQEYGFTPRPNILAASKQAPADVDWLQWRDGAMLDAKVANIAKDMPIIMAWKNGEVEAPRCEKASCLYCRSTKKLKRPRVPVSAS